MTGLSDWIYPIAIWAVICFGIGLLVGEGIAANHAEEGLEEVQEAVEATALPSIHIESEGEVTVIVDGACDVKISTPGEVTLTMGWTTTVSTGDVCSPSK